MGVAGIETNQGQYSQYPVSKNILQFVKRSDKYELGADAVSSGEVCPDLKMDGIWLDEHGNRFQISQTSCLLFINDLGGWAIRYTIPLDGNNNYIPDSFYALRQLRNEDYVSSIEYTAKVSDSGVPTVSFWGDGYLPQLPDFDFQLSFDVTAHLTEMANPVEELISDRVQYESQSSVTCDASWFIVDGNTCKTYAVMDRSTSPAIAPATVQAIKLSFSNLKVSLDPPDSQRAPGAAAFVNSALGFATSLANMGEKTIWLVKTNEADLEPVSITGPMIESSISKSAH